MKIKQAATKLHKSPDETDKARSAWESPSNERLRLRAKTGLRGILGTPGDSDSNSTPCLSQYFLQVVVVVVVVYLLAMANKTCNKNTMSFTKPGNQKANSHHTGHL